MTLLCRAGRDGGACKHVKPLLSDGVAVSFIENYSKHNCESIFSECKFLGWISGVGSLSLHSVSVWVDDCEFKQRVLSHVLFNG